MARLPLQTNARAGSVQLLEGYRSAASLTTGQLYRARPTRALKLPSMWVESITEATDAFTVEESQRVVRVVLRIVWGAYDTGEAVDQRDKFIDGFYAYTMDHHDAFGANAEVYMVGTSDDPDFSPSWLTEGETPYFMTEIFLEGRAST